MLIDAVRRGVQELKSETDHLRSRNPARAENLPEPEKGDLWARDLVVQSVTQKLDELESEHTRPSNELVHAALADLAKARATELFGLEEARVNAEGVLLENAKKNPVEPAPPDADGRTTDEAQRRANQLYGISEHPEIRAKLARQLVAPSEILSTKQGFTPTQRDALANLTSAALREPARYWEGFEPYAQRLGKALAETTKLLDLTDGNPRNNRPTGLTPA